MNIVALTRRKVRMCNVRERTRQKLKFSPFKIFQKFYFGRFFNGETSAITYKKFNSNIAGSR